MFTFFEVGGKVRDEILGIKSKDIDYVAVIDQEKLNHMFCPADFSIMHLAFTSLENFLILQGYQIFLSTPKCLTIRARFPEDHPNQGTVADFVLARKEIGYIPGTRTPIVQPGSLHDDLLRRDFTINAMARDTDGHLIDPFGGQQDLKDRILRTPIDPEITFNDDPLRLIRAIRFKITKGLQFHPDVWKAIRYFNYKEKMHVVSEERIREELYKAFKADTLGTMGILCDNPKLATYIFDNRKLWLKPTNEY